MRKNAEILVERFNLKMLVEGSLVRLVPLSDTYGINRHFEITIPDDKYIDNKIINVKDDFRTMLEEFMKQDESVKDLHWNNTGSTFRFVFNPRPV